jgi:hypothetical protein
MATPVDFSHTLRLLDDHNRCAEGVHAEDDVERQFWRRLTYSTFFTAVEAWINVVHEHLLQPWVDDRLASMANDERRAVEKLRKINVDQEKFTKRLATTVRLCLLLSGYSAEQVNEMVSEPIFGLIAKTVNVRHRITHPKNNDGYEITNVEIVELSTVFQWYMTLQGILHYPAEPTIQLDPQFMD